MQQNNLGVCLLNGLVETLLCGSEQHNVISAHVEIWRSH